MLRTPVFENKICKICIAKYANFILFLSSLLICEGLFFDYEPEFRVSGTTPEWKIKPIQEIKLTDLRRYQPSNALINWNPVPPPTPGLCGAMWGIFMVFEVMVSPWGWGISQDLLSVFIWQSGNEVGTWFVPSLLTAISSRDHRYFDVSGFELGGFHVTSSPPCWWTVNKRSLISSLCLSTSICSFHHGYLCLPRLHENHLLFFLSFLLLRFCLELSWFVDWKLLLLFKTSQTMQIQTPLLIIKGAVSRLSGSFC